MSFKGRTTGFLAIAVAGMVILAGFGPGQSQADTQFRWLCKPGRAGDPCIGERGSLKTERVTAGGPAGFSTPKSLTRLRKKIDCFYVYPTVSGQEGPNATLAEDPEIDGIARQQASRFAPGCRMFAPIYKEFTINAILSGKITEEVNETAYRSMKAAWNQYLRKYNKGRGIVLIGHSQGTGHLKRLIADTFDQKKKLRNRLVSAVLVGGNVIVAKDKRAGGDFTRIPACAKASELGCVIAFSSYLKDPPPSNSLFGRVGGALSGSGFDPATHEVMCVNPARLDGSRGVLKPLYETTPFPGIYGPLLPDLSSYGAPWVSFPRLYSASCQSADGASWLSVQDISNGSDARPRIGEPLGRTWGTHLTEVNDTAGNLVRVVASQEKAYVKKLNKARKAKAKR